MPESSRNFVYLPREIIPRCSLFNLTRVMLQTWPPISQSLLAANIVWQRIAELTARPLWCSILLSCHRLSSILRFFEPGRAGSAFHTWQPSHSLIRICFSFNETFSLLPYIFNHILCEQIERFDLPMALVMRSSNIKLQMSSFKPQDVERKAKRVLNTNKKVLPSRWASWGAKRPPSRDVMCFCRIQRMWKFFKASIPPTYMYPSRKLKEHRLVLCYSLFNSTNVRISSSFRELVWYRKLPNENWMNRPMHVADNSPIQTTPITQRKSQDFQFWKTDIKNINATLKLKILIYTWNIDKSLIKSCCGSVL